MRIIVLLFLGGFLFSSCHPLQRLAFLPDFLNENSGMLLKENKLWLHNDSGDEPILYAFNFNSDELQKVQIAGAKNIDWEDLTADRSGNIYIGDFGNNRNQRKDLCIYKISAPASEDTVISAQKIAFHYPDQLQFPPKPDFLHFDVEAMIALGDSLYLFTKNRTKPNNGYVKLYRLPQKAGKYTAVLQDSFKIKRGRFRKSITSAALSEDGQTLALLSMGRVRIFKEFEGTDFFNAQVQKQYRLWFTQKEAVAFKTNELLYISDERSPLGKARLYQLSLKKVKAGKK